MIFLCRRKISFVLETKFHPGEMRNVVTVLLATAIPAKDSIAPDTLFTCRVKEILMRLVGHVIAKETFVTELFRSSSTPFCFAVTDFCLRPPDYTLFRNSLSPANPFLFNLRRDLRTESRQRGKMNNLPAPKRQTFYLLCHLLRRTLQLIL